MHRISHVLPLILLLSALGVLGQDSLEKYSAPVAWQEYQVRSQKLSFTFPKMPVVRKEANLCAQVEGRVYYAYANGVVYEFEWHTKSGDAIPGFCTRRAKFSKATFDNRIEELKAQTRAFEEAEGTVAGLPAKVLRSTSTGQRKVRWLIWDTDRWLELGITRRTEKIEAEAGFLDGLNLKTSTGINVKDGADATLGDSDADAKNDPTEKISSGLSIVTKPRPGYTDAARQSNTQGTVVLRVVFLKNGGIGEITPVKGLSDGLTEQSIAAAKKIAFLPAIVDGTPVTVTKQIEYSFSIY